MTIQFRSRLKSVVDYTSELTSFGICCQYNKISEQYTQFKSTANQCYANQGSESTITKTFYPGVEDDGTFTCTESSTERGCCCACKYAKESQNYQEFLEDQNLLPVNSGDKCSIESTTTDIALHFDVGLRDDVEQCECQRLGGKWTAGQCPTETGNDTDDAAAIRTYCYDSVVIIPPEDPDEKDPEDPQFLGTCCYNCASNEGGQPADCSCCEQNIEQNTCQNTLAGFWRSNFTDTDGMQVSPSCGGCVTAPVYGVCYSESTGNCWSVWSNDIDPNLSDQDIKDRVCRSDIGSGDISISQGDEIFLRDQTCATARQANGATTPKFPKIFRKLDCDNNPGCICEGNCTEIASTPSETGNGGVYLKSCYMGINSPDADQVVSVSETVPEWQVLYNSTRRISDDIWTQDRNVGPWFCGPCQSDNLSQGGDIANNFKMRYPISSSGSTERTCGERGYYHKIEKQGLNYSLSVTQVPSTTNSNDFTCTSKIYTPTIGFKHGFGKCERTNYPEVTTDTIQAYFTYAPLPATNESDFSDVYTEEFGWGHGVCCNYNAKTCEFTFQHNCFGTFTNWKNLLLRLKKNVPSFASIFQETPQQQLVLVQGYFNQKKCLDSNSTPVACEACDSVCNFIGYACTVPCSTTGCQCQETTYDLYTTQKCPTNCTDCATQEAGSGCCKRWYGPDDNQCEGSTQYTTVSCDIPEPPVLGICCNKSDPTNPCVFDVPVEQSQCQYEWIEGATNCALCSSNLIACCDHRYNKCTPNVEPQNCGDYFYERPALDSNGDPVNDCSKCNFEAIDIPGCQNINASIQVNKPDCSGSLLEKNECLCSTGVCCRGDGTPNPAAAGGGLADQPTCYQVNDIEWFLDESTNTYYPRSSFCGQGANKLDPLYLTNVVPSGNELEVYSSCYASANEQFNGADIFSDAPDILVSGDAIPYGVCCQYKEIDATTIQPNGCVLVKATRNFCGNTRLITDPNIKNRWIASYYECKDIWIYESPGDPAGSGCSRKITLPKYDCDICTKVVGDINADPTSTAWNPEYLYPGTSFRTSDGVLKDYYDYMPGTLPYTTAVKTCELCDEKLFYYYKQFFSHISGSRSKYYFNGLPADYIQARNTKPICTGNPTDSEVITEDCCNNQVITPSGGVFNDSYMTLKQDWKDNRYNRESCKCNPNYNTPDCVCAKPTTCNLTEEELEEYCEIVPDNGLCCGPNGCAGIVTEAECINLGSEYTWYNNTPYDNNANCPSPDPCNLGVCCQGTSCTENVRRFDCSSPNTFVSYDENPQGCATNPCNTVTGRCCAYGTGDPLDALAEAQTSCSSFLTESACLNLITSTGLDGTQFNVKSVVWKEGENCNNKQFTFVFNNTLGTLQTIQTSSNPCRIGTCCTGNTTQGTESCLGLTAAHNCPGNATPGSGGLKFIPGNSNCSTGTESSCNLSLCCTGFDAQGNRIFDGTGSSTTTYQNCTADIQLDNKFVLACSYGTLGGLPLSEPKLCEYGVCCQANGLCLGLRRRINCQYTCSGELDAASTNIFVPVNDLGSQFNPNSSCNPISLGTNWCAKGICCIDGTCVEGTRGQCYALDPSADFRAGDTCNSNPYHCKLGYYCPNTGSNCTLPTCNPPQVSCLQDNQQGFFVQGNKLHNSEWSLYSFTENVSTCIDACDPSLGSCCPQNTSTCEINKTQAECPNGWSINNNCTDCKGACCSSAGACSYVTKATCDAQSGIYKGNGVSCESNPCFGACCCFGEETPCSQVTNIGTTTSAQQNCSTGKCSVGGIYTNNKTCAEAPPCAGACCDGTNGNCSQKTAIECTSLSGSRYFGNAAQCSPQTCKGACCNNTNGICSDVLKSNCSTTTSTFKGFATFCDPDEDPCTVPTGSCCVLSTGSCSVTTQIACCPSGDCAAAGKAWTNGGSCIPNPCAQPKVPCCFASSNSCNQSTYDTDSCTKAGGTPLSLGSTCNDCTGSCCEGDDLATCTDGVRKSACANTGAPCNPPKHTIGKSCSQVSCPLAKYPCCSNSGGTISCSQRTLDECAAVGGVRSGECTDSCTSGTCGNYGACCFPDGNCYEEFANLCENAGGTPTIGQSCNQINCQPAGSFSCCTYTYTPGCSGDASSSVTCSNVSSENECPPDIISIPITIQCDEDGDGVFEEKTVDKIVTKYFNSGSPCVGNDCDACSTAAPPASECFVQCCFDGVPGGCVYETQCLNAGGLPSGPCDGDCGTSGPGTGGGLLTSSTSSTCSYCCGCVDGRVRDCCYEKVDGRFVCDAEINSSQNKGICEANQSHGSYCDTTQEIPVCAWVENNQTQYSNHRCVTLTDCEGTYTGTTKVSTSGSALVLKAGEEEIECYVDKRIPRACCYIAYDANDFPVGITCENVCTSIECETKSPVYSEVATTNLGRFNCIDDIYNFDNTDGGYCRTWCACGKNYDSSGDSRCYETNDTEDVDFGVPPGFRYCGSIQSNAEGTYNITSLTPKEASYPSIYNTGTLCGKELLQGKGSFNCGIETEGFLLKSSYRFSSNYLRDINTGTCFNLVKKDDGTYEYECDLSFKTDCTAKGGYFVTLVDSGNNICTGSHVPTAPQFDTNQQLIAQTMSETDFLNEGLIFGDYKWGGYFVGIFKPGETQVYGSDPETLDRPLYRKSKISSYGKSTGKGWALFIQDISYKVRYFDPRNEQSLRVSNKTSMHDGFNNCYKTQFVETGNLFKKFYLINAGGFADYYLPSLEEMEFLASKLHEDPENYFTYLKKLHRGDIDNSVFWTSSAFNTNLVYATYLDVENVKDFGKVVLVPAHSREIYNAFFVRRIELT